MTADDREQIHMESQFLEDVTGGGEADDREQIQMDSNFFKDVAEIIKVSQTYIIQSVEFLIRKQ